MSAANSYRLFIAIELPAEVRRHIKEYVDKLRRGFPDVRVSWTREENLHLTMKFLGDTPIDQVESLNHALQRATNQISRFKIVIHRTGSFPSHGKPNVLWIGIDDPSGNLHKLHEQLEQECSRVSFPIDDRPYHPHLTIARMRSKGGARDLAQLHRDSGFGPAHVKVRDLCMIKSELSSAGSRYTIIARQPLK